MLFRLSSPESREAGFEIWAFLEPRVVMVIGGAMVGEDLEDLINLRVSHKQRFFFNHFCKNAAQRPNVHTQGILFLTHQNFWSSIPESLHLMSQGFYRNTESSCQTEVSQFYVSLFVN
jgi:hypothetical protein